MTIVGGFIVSFSASWKVSLVMLAFIPLLVLSGLAFNIFLGGGALELSQTGAGHVSRKPNHYIRNTYKCETPTCLLNLLFYVLLKRYVGQISTVVAMETPNRFYSKTK